jgi:hypothetical protein
VAKDDGFLRAIKVRSMTSFRRELKILWYVKNPYEYERDTL